MRPILPLLLLAASASAADGYAVIDDNRRPMLGIEMTPVSSTIQDREGLSPGQGVQVVSVFANTAAQQMGLAKGDVILAVNGQPIASMNELRNEVGLNQVGDPVEVTVLRDGRTIEPSGSLQPWPAEIPYTPLDAAAEKRFRDWQERRQARLNDEARQLREGLRDLARRLDDQDPPGPGEAGLPDAGLGLPAFRLRVRVPTGTAPEAAPDTAAAPAPERAGFADPRAGAGPWTARLRIATTR